MSKLFNQVKINKQKRNAFDLSHERKFSMNMGDLVPIMCEEVIPGDTFQLNTETLLRMAPMVAPVMHRVNVYTHFFFVPNRLIWRNWQDFITGTKGTSGYEPTSPYILITNTTDRDLLKAGSLADYLGMGIPPTTTQLPVINNQTQINALPFRAYQMIYNEYYRDQNLQEKIEFTDGDANSEEDGTLLSLRKRCWEKDYFTSALPWTQKGDPVSIPLSGVAPVELDLPQIPEPPLFQRVVDSSGNPMAGGNYLKPNAGDLVNDDGATDPKAYIDPNGTYQVDLDEASIGIQVNEMRRALKLQQWLERNARAGSRYIEQIFAHFGVKSSDSRLQRPEYLGGGKSPVVISEVLQTASTNEKSPQGNMAGHGMAAGNTNGFRKFFEEHGYIIGIMSVLPRTAYQQGHRRFFIKDDKFDYYWPEFANLGEQEVYDSEIFADYTADGANGQLKAHAFGYQSRYAEYKFVPSSVHGDFKKRDNGLDKWHMGRVFIQPPQLSDEFVSSEDVTHRIFAVTDPSYHKLYVQVYNNLKAIRPMPYFGIPSI